MDNSKDSGTTEIDFDMTNEESNGKKNFEDAETESEIKVGNIKDIQQTDMVSISKDYNKIKAAEVSVNSNFLFLRAGANALLPKKGPKRKHPPKKICIDSEGKNTEEKDSSESKSKPKVERSPYYCKVCEVELNSEATYMTHIEGKKHQKKLDTMDIKLPRRAKRTEKLQYMKIKEGCRIPRIPKPGAQPHMKSTFDDIQEPRLGLQFISEIWLLDESAEDVYYCSLCAITCGPNAIVSHIVGFKHRLAYMKLYDAGNYEEVKNLSSKKSELTAVLHAHAVKLEKSDGAGKVKVEVEVDEDYMMEEDNFGGMNMGEPNLNPKNVNYLPSYIKLRFLEETVTTCDVPPFINRKHVESLTHSLQNLKVALGRYNPLDNMLKRRILHFLEQTASLEKMDGNELESWRPAPSRSEFMGDNAGPSDRMQGGHPDFMYDSMGPQNMRDQYGAMGRNNYPMNMRQNVGYDNFDDIPPFPYGNNQGNAQGIRNHGWGPMVPAAADGGGNGGYGGHFQGRGGQKRLYSVRGD